MYMPDAFTNFTPPITNSHENINTAVLRVRTLNIGLKYISLKRLEMHSNATYIFGIFNLV